MPPDRPGGQHEAVLEGFGRATASVASVCEVGRPGDVASLLRSAGPRGVLARGLGRSYGDAATNAGGTVLRLPSGPVHLDVEQGTVSAPAGTTLDELLALLVPRGWFVPVTPGTRRVTLGGAVAADVHGKNHHQDGSLGSHVSRLRLVTPQEGVHEVGPDDDPDVFWATVGGMGLTGVVTDLTLGLLPIRSSRVVVDTERTADLDDLFDRMERDDHRYRYSVAWVDTGARGRALGRGVLTRGDHAEPHDLPSGERHAPLAYAPARSLPLPPLPVRAVRPATIRLFNEAWFRRAPQERRGEVQSLARFFHPLDGLEGWNRLYGPGGFVQYQLVVPVGAEDVVQQVVETLGRRDLPSGMAVLKRFGEANPAPLSFPMPGWTLALDLAVGPPHLAAVLRDFDERVAGAGGRIYLAKDACLRPDVFAAMYPRLDEWRRVRDRLDPDGVLQSDLARRLHLTSPGGIHA